MTAEMTWQTAMNYLGHREATAAMVRLYLKIKGHSAEAAAQAVAKLVDLQLVNDERWARIMIRDAMRARRGDGYISGKLREKGVKVDREVLGVWIEEERLQLGNDPIEEAFAWAERRYGRVEEKDYRSRNRVLQGLVRRGFSFSIAKAVLARLGAGE